MYAKCVVFGILFLVFFIVLYHETRLNAQVKKKKNLYCFLFVFKLKCPRFACMKLEVTTKCHYL